MVNCLAEAGAHNTGAAVLQPPPPPPNQNKKHLVGKLYLGFKLSEWVSHRTCSYICRCMNAVASNAILQLYLWHDFCNVVFKIKHNELYIYTASGSVPPQANKKSWVCAWAEASVQTGSGTPLILLFNGYGGSLPRGYSGWDMKLTVQLHLVLRLTVNGAIYLHGMYRDNFTHSALHLLELHIPYNLFR
jgi:hypothetical protein